jgi:hypothetical protein
MEDGPRCWDCLSRRLTRGDHVHGRLRRKTVPGSPFATAALVTLEEKQASYRVEPIAPGVMRSDAYRELHPFARMPVLDHGDFRLYETQAILR